MKVNITIDELTEEQAHYLEIFLRNHYIVKDFKVIPDTSELYDNDPNFRRMVKLIKDAQRDRDRYINEKR